MRTLTTLFLIGLMSPLGAWAADVPDWIWLETEQDNQRGWFRAEFDVEGDIASAVVAGTCDNRLALFINGKQLIPGRARDWGSILASDATPYVTTGKNTIAVRGENTDGVAGMFCRLTITHNDGTKTVVVSNDDWTSTGDQPVVGWNKVGYDDSTWTPVKVIGAVGSSSVTWTSRVTIAALESVESVDLNPTPVARPVTNLNLLPGFKAEIVYTVPKVPQGSWVSMTNAPDGGMYVSDQGGTGLYHVMPAKLGDPESKTVVTPQSARITGAHGLFWAFGGLYVHVSEGGKGGLYKATDSNNDGDLDKVERLIRHPFGGGEHGPHGIRYTEDKKALYINAGNHTDLPEITGSRAPSNWQEDLLLPRQWDARGHAKGRLAPGGWICRVTPDGKSWEVVSSGYRNEYDLGMNPEGELFAYDADMEWDIGSPWYRPTRLCHAVSGSEFGWRSGTGKWPTYYEDSLPPVVEIGPGSPTGVVFGTEAKFPAKYQQAVYLLDWTFGTIYAIHMTPDGASYKGVKEEFVSGSPLAVTDTVMGADGAFYFTVGGRGTQSALYRVYYDGSESTKKTPRKESSDTIKARKLRRSLEKFHGKKDNKAVKIAWPYLGHEDRFIRFAARIAIEAQPVSEWKSRALSESDPQAAAIALIALARQGDAGSQEDLLEALAKFDIAKVDESIALGLLRAHALCFTRMGRPDQKILDAVTARLDPHLPSDSDNINTEIVRLLVYLDAPGIIEKGMDLLADARPPRIPEWAELLKRNSGYGGTIQRMLDNHPPIQKINYALMLRNVRYGWSMDQREQYFNFINEAATHTGGASYEGFLNNIRDEALANCSEAEKVALASITGKSLEALPEFDVRPAKGPGQEWSLDGALASYKKSFTRKRDFKNGRNAYFALGCVKCHRFDGAGGGVGPDLSSVNAKFSISDMLEAMIDPSKDISDQYSSSVVEMNNGDYIDGIVVNHSGSKEEGEISIYTDDLNADAIVVKTADVKSIEASTTSQMPDGLLDVLNEDEMLDLLAYLRSRGNPEDSAFN
ncbi:MAG: heme-binding protein [Candidatus Hydrogenedentota bacterium]